MGDLARRQIPLGERGARSRAPSGRLRPAQQERRKKPHRKGRSLGWGRLLNRNALPRENHQGRGHQQAVARKTAAVFGEPHRHIRSLSTDTPLSTSGYWTHRLAAEVRLTPGRGWRNIPVEAMGFALKCCRFGRSLMTPTDKALLEGRGFPLRSHDPRENYTPGGFLFGHPC